MKREFFTIIAATLFALACVAFARAGRAQDAANGAIQPPFDGVLLLKSGGVLRGQISQSADRWIVSSEGRETNVPAPHVEMACRSLEEAYHVRRSRLGRVTAEAHLALADWCLRYELLPQAQIELRDARQLDARHPRLRLLEERLAIASRPQPAKVTPSVEVAAKEPPPVAAAASTLTPARLSDAALERFTRNVQPVLVNNCATAGCHQLGGAQQFQLDRALIHGMANRRSTMNNLTATLALIDHERPQLSPLLTVPRTAHGGMKRPVFGPHQDALVVLLQEWVATVTAGADQQALPTMTKPSSSGPAAESSTTAAKDAGPLDVVEATTAPASTPGPRMGANAEPWRPKDPFDPEIFNRRYHGPNKNEP
jgi:hypothetical protein